MMSNYPDELTCDMAETYGIFDIKRVPVKLLATLAVGLRDNSRVKQAKTGTKYSDEVILLAAIADAVRWLQWANSKDAQSGENCPEAILDYYLGRKAPEPEHVIFDSPEDFDAKWKEITGN